MYTWELKFEELEKLIGKIPSHLEDRKLFEYFTNKIISSRHYYSEFDLLHRIKYLTTNVEDCLKKT